MNLRHRPSGGDVLHRDRGRGIDLTGAIAGFSQFVGQSHRKAAGMCGRNQFGGIRALALNLAAGGVRGALQNSTGSADGTFAALASAQPKD